MFSIKIEQNQCIGANDAVCLLMLLYLMIMWVKLNRVIH